MFKMKPLLALRASPCPCGLFKNPKRKHKLSRQLLVEAYAYRCDNKDSIKRTLCYPSGTLRVRFANLKPGENPTYPFGFGSHFSSLYSCAWRSWSFSLPKRTVCKGKTRVGQSPIYGTLNPIRRRYRVTSSSSNLVLKPARPITRQLDVYAKGIYNQTSSQGYDKMSRERGHLAYLKPMSYKERPVLFNPEYEMAGLTTKPETNNQSKKGFSSPIYFNLTFNKGRLRQLISWALMQFGENKTVALVDMLKTLGYNHATRAGISLGIDDLIIPKTKQTWLIQGQAKLNQTQLETETGHLNAVEYSAQVITTWNNTNDQIKKEVIASFRAKDMLNPVYMMAFSGARGNISQVHQLAGMRGLMSDPTGQIIDFPIESNFREGLTLTEYMISCYGARKGVVDTALRTATSGYLTRRLVDVAHHVVIRELDCGSKVGIYLSDLKKGSKTLLNLKNRLVGRTLAEDISGVPNAKRNQEIQAPLADMIVRHKVSYRLRSPLTCRYGKMVCQRCYGWGFASGYLVPVGESVGVIAAQSIGEPGTQLTMRTFHTGGVFSGEISDEIRCPCTGTVQFDQPIAGKCVRTSHGQIAYLIQESGILRIDKSILTLEPMTLVFVKQGQTVFRHQVLAEVCNTTPQRNAESFVNVNCTMAGQIRFDPNMRMQYVPFKNLRRHDYRRMTQNKLNHLKTILEKRPVRKLWRRRARAPKLNWNVKLTRFWVLAAATQTLVTNKGFFGKYDLFENQSPIALYSSNKPLPKLKASKPLATQSQTTKILLSRLTGLQQIKYVAQPSYQKKLYSFHVNPLSVYTKTKLRLKNFFNFESASLPLSPYQIKKTQYKSLRSHSLGTSRLIPNTTQLWIYQKSTLRPHLSMEISYESNRSNSIQKRFMDVLREPWLLISMRRLEIVPMENPCPDLSDLYGTHDLTGSKIRTMPDFVIKTWVWKKELKAFKYDRKELSEGLGEEVSKSPRQKRIERAKEVCQFVIRATTVPAHEQGYTPQKSTILICWQSLNEVQYTSKPLLKSILEYQTENLASPMHWTWTKKSKDTFRSFITLKKKRLWKRATVFQNQMGQVYADFYIPVSLFFRVPYGVFLIRMIHRYQIQKQIQTYFHKVSISKSSVRFKHKVSIGSYTPQLKFRPSKRSMPSVSFWVQSLAMKMNAPKSNELSKTPFVSSLRLQRRSLLTWNLPQKQKQNQKKYQTWKPSVDITKKRLYVKTLKKQKKRKKGFKVKKQQVFFRPANVLIKKAKLYGWVSITLGVPVSYHNQIRTSGQGHTSPAIRDSILPCTHTGVSFVSVLSLRLKPDPISHNSPWHQPGQWLNRSWNPIIDHAPKPMSQETGLYTFLYSQRSNQYGVFDLPFRASWSKQERSKSGPKVTYQTPVFIARTAYLKSCCFLKPSLAWINKMFSSRLKNPKSRLNNLPLGFDFVKYDVFKSELLSLILAYVTPVRFELENRTAVSLSRSQMLNYHGRYAFLKVTWLSFVFSTPSVDSINTQPGFAGLNVFSKHFIPQRNPGLNLVHIDVNFYGRYKPLCFVLWEKRYFQKASCAYVISQKLWFNPKPYPKALISWVHKNAWDQTKFSPRTHLSDMFSWDKWKAKSTEAFFKPITCLLPQRVFNSAVNSSFVFDPPGVQKKTQVYDQKNPKNQHYEVQLSGVQGELLSLSSNEPFQNHRSLSMLRLSQNTVFKPVFHDIITRRQPVLYSSNVRSDTQLCYVTKKHLTSYPVYQSLDVRLGQLLTPETDVSRGQKLSHPGQIFRLTKTHATLRRAQYFRVPSSSTCDLRSSHFVSIGTPILSVRYKNVTTEDIIQGIPKVERLFEARSRRGTGLPQLVKAVYRLYKPNVLANEPKRRSVLLKTMLQIQVYIVNSIQSVYQSQGVNISDKHLEVIVKQMTCKVLVTNPGVTSLLDDDAVALDLIRVICRRLTPFERDSLVYEPLVLGITKASLQAQGFLSAASFQETIRVLTYAALVQRRDFLRGLKENVILGYLLPMGTHAYSLKRNGNKVPIHKMGFETDVPRKTTTDPLKELLNLIITSKIMV
jgi:RNA polymerase Rpb1, domain 5/RNA polymerase Rpb1, domain 4